MSAGFFVVLPWEPGKVTGVFVIWPLKSVLDLVRDCNPKFERLNKPFKLNMAERVNPHYKLLNIVQIFV